MSKESVISALFYGGIQVLWDVMPRDVEDATGVDYRKRRKEL